MEHHREPWLKPDVALLRTADSALSGTEADSVEGSDPGLRTVVPSGPA